MQSAIILAAAMAATFFTTASFAEEAQAEKVEFKIESQPMETALTTLGAQSGLTIIVETKVAKGVTAPALNGTYTSEEALQKILKPAGLKAEYLDKKTVAIRSASEPAAITETASRTNYLTLAENAGVQSAVPDKRNTEDTSGNVGGNTQDKSQEVVVTGTQIRGATSIASPISVFGREDIDRSGAGSVQRFIQNLPENFKGGASEGTVISSAGGGTALNSTAGTAFNLRGLGNDSTLTLLDGRRFAPNNTAGNFVDVSMIPLAAIERIEVMPDGASALYGSDAVGGVVNFIMKKDYAGTEARVRYAASSEGGLREQQVGLTSGTSWGSGSVLMSYEYFHQDPLNLAEKSWAPAGFVEPFEAVSAMKRHGVFINVRQSLGENTEVFGSALYSDKKVPSYRISSPGVSANNYMSDNVAYDLTAGLRMDLARAQALELVATFGEGEALTDTWSTSSTQPVAARISNTVTHTGVLALDAKLSGPLFDLPAGPLSYAAGLHHRDERFRDASLFRNVLNLDRERTSWAAFAEVRAPLVASAEGRPLLEMSLAGRYEDYDDFGDTFNPKVGLIFSPSRDLRLRGTWGTSFKAPLLTDLNPVHSQTAALMAFDPTLGATAPVFVVFGGNPGLMPEEATSWTVGFDWTPQSMPTLKARMTYYNIAYDERITNPQLAFQGVVPNTVVDALSYESLLARFITRNPTAAQLQAFIANSTRYDDFTGIPGGVNLANGRAVIDYRVANLSSVDTSGLDFGISVKPTFGGYALTAGIDGTYILKFDNQLAPNTPVLEGYNSVFNPVDLRLRGHLAVDKGPFSAGLYVNYIDSYTDVRLANNPIPVSSWTTLDLNLGYTFSESAGALSGLELGVGATNLADKDPPYIRPTRTGLTLYVFDGANHDLRGRVVYAQLTKRF